MHSKLCRRRQEGEPEPILCVRSKEGKNLKEKKNTDIHKEWDLSVVNTASAVLLHVFILLIIVLVCVRGYVPAVSLMGRSQDSVLESLPPWASGANLGSYSFCIQYLQSQLSGLGHF